MLGLGAPPLLPPLVAMRVLGESHAGADADDLQYQWGPTWVGVQCYVHHVEGLPLTPTQLR